MKDIFSVTPWQLDFLTNAYISKKLYEKHCYEADKKYGLTINEGEVLLSIYLRGGESTARDIVEQNWISKSQISKSVERLTAMGFITQKTDEKDRRFVRLRLTDNADVVIADLEKATSIFLEKMFEGLNEEEILQFNHLIEKVADNIRRTTNESA